MPESMSTNLRRTLTATWLLFLTVGWLHALGVGPAAADPDPGVPSGVVLTVPVGGAVHGAPGASVVRATVDVPLDVQGQRCELRVEGENQWSVHPGNDLIVLTGDEAVVVVDFEGAPNAVTAVTAGSVVLGSSLSVSVRFGADGVSSGGVRVVVDACVAPGPPPTATPSSVPTTILPNGATTTLPTATSEPGPTSSPTPTSEPVPAGPTTVSSVAPSTTPDRVVTTAPPTVPTTAVPTTAAPTTAAPSTPPTTVAVEGPVASPPDDTAPDGTAPDDIAVEGIQQLPETGATTTTALIGATMLTIGWFLVRLERRLVAVPVDA
ncbi:MAG: hypothetical protein ACRBI6_06190 [Acidimicrobiales bacterium]